LAGRLLKTSASKLSAGQRRRVALAVLTARWPELWLLDEPHAGLDASARDTLDRLITDAGTEGVTVLIASHETGFVESLAARAVTVTGGRITGGRSIGGPIAGAPSTGEPTFGSSAGPTAGSDALPVLGPDVGGTGGGAGRPAGQVAHVA
jgi:energy-coupling factor transporter ATP-binding protein EcfA2